MNMKAFKFACLMGAVVALLGAGCKDDGPDLLPEFPDAAPAPDAAPPSFDAATCDPIAQDCSEPAGKCSLDLSQTATASTWAITCRAQTGIVAVGQTCLRNGAGAAGVGKDNCDKGLYCSAIGNHAGDTSEAARICHEFCRSNDQCTVGAHPACFALTAGLAANDTGICIDGCNILTNDGICTGGTWCEPAKSMSGAIGVGICAKAGTVDLNGTCTDTEICKAGLMCVGAAPNFTCKTVCDIVASPGVPAHPCPENFTCRALNGGPIDWGVCQANP